MKKRVAILALMSLLVVNTGVVPTVVYAVEAYEDDNTNDFEDMDDEEEDTNDPFTETNPNPTSGGAIDTGSETEEPEQNQNFSIIDYENMSDDEYDGSDEEHPLQININKYKYIKFIDDYSISKNKITFSIDKKYKKYFTVNKTGQVRALKTMKAGQVVCVNVKSEGKTYKLYVTCMQAINVKLTWKQKTIKFKPNVTSAENAVLSSNVIAWSYYKSSEPDKLVNTDRKDFILKGDYKSCSLTACGVIRIDPNTGVETYYPKEKLASIKKVQVDKKYYWRIQTLAVPKSVYYDEEDNITTDIQNASGYRKEGYQVFKWKVDGSTTYFKVKISGKKLY